MLSNIKKQDIASLYKAGRTIRQISETTGAGQATIIKVIKWLKIKQRGEHCLRINRAKLKNLPEDYMSRKLSIKALLKKYNVKSEHTLYRILDEFKVPRHRLIIKGDLNHQ